MAAIGTHLSHFIQNDTRSVLEWVSTAAKWIGFEHFGSVLERADQGFHMADAAADVVHFYRAAGKVTDLTSAARALSKGSSFLGNVASSIDFLSHIQAITVESGLLSRISLIGNVASLAKSAYKVANQAHKIVQYAAPKGTIDQLKLIRQSTKLTRTVTKVVSAVLAIAVFVGGLVVSPFVLLAMSSGVLILTTVSYLLKREIHRLERPGV